MLEIVTWRAEFRPFDAQVVGGSGADDRRGKAQGVMAPSRGFDGPVPDACVMRSLLTGDLSVSAVV